MPAGKQSVRIIGGRWRRRLLRFPDVPALRPTPDRVRETLFNWLEPRIQGAHCLDLFTGSGALALEALSRGAHKVVAVDLHPLAIDALRRNAADLRADGLDVLLGDAREFLRQDEPRQFDIVFVDPPFDADLHAEIAAALSTGSWLSARALLYMESPGDVLWDGGPGWRVLRDKAAGQVRYRLFEKVDASGNG